MGRSGYNSAPESSDPFDLEKLLGFVAPSATSRLEEVPKAPGIDQSEFSEVLGNRLSEDLGDIDLARFENILTARLKDFALRSANEHDGEDHLGRMIYIYQNSRYDCSKVFALSSVDVQAKMAQRIDKFHLLRTIAAGICRKQSRLSMGGSGFESREISSGTRRQSTKEEGQRVKDPQALQDFPPAQSVQGLLDKELILGEEELLSSEAYRWLVSMVQRSSRLGGIKPDCMEGHRERMTWRVEGSTDSEIWAQDGLSRTLRLRPPPLYAVTFNLSWDLLTFLREEYDSENPAEVVGQVITLTGDGDSVQAQSCRGYLEQVWPTTGSSFMNMIEELVKGTGKRCECVLPDRTQISALLNDGVCTFEALGTQPGLGDVVEQLLWVSTALRTPEKLNEGKALCSAKLFETTEVPIFLPRPDTQTPHDRVQGVFGFRVEHATRQPRREVSDADGGCWSDLFRICPIVSGYPIPTRNPNMRGLEIPLDMMASLICAERVTSFGYDLVIKGYSDLLYATGYHGEYVVWHLICNKSTPASGRSRISFSDERIPQPEDQRVPFLRGYDVLSLRHIVGWANTVRSNAGQFSLQVAGILTLTISMWQGAPDVEYSTITSSDLTAPPQGWALDRVQVTAGKYVTASVGFVRGKKDKPIHRIQEDYISRLLDIQETKFVLFDVDIRKAWLVNGLSTLLHLVRSHLTYAENDEVHQSILLTKASELKAMGGRNGLKAAFETLSCDSNRILRLHRKGGTSQKGKTEQVSEEYYSLEDLVKDLLQCLEQIVDHQSDFRSERASAGYRIKTSPWAQLEGYDFMEVASGRRQVSSRGIRLLPDGKGWAQLTRALGAPTLFGKHFGEILEPDSPDSNQTGCAACHWNDVMPPMRDLLAVQMEDILKAGREDCGILHFADGLCLDVHLLLFESCSRDEPIPMCQTGERIRTVQRTSDIVQSSAYAHSHSKVGPLAKEWLNVKWTRGRAEDGDVGISSSSTAKMAPTGAILLGVPREPSENGSKERRGLLGVLFRDQSQSHSLTKSPQLRVSPSPSNSTTTSNSASNSKTSCSQTETTPLTPSSNSGLLPDCTEKLLRPDSPESNSLQPSADDYHRRKRALRRQENKP